MTSGQKFSVSLLISVVIFAFFSVFALSGRFDFLEAKFYQPAVRQPVEQKVRELAELEKQYNQILFERFASFASEEAVLSFTKSVSSDEEVKARSMVCARIFSSSPYLSGIRIVDSNGKKIHYSSFDGDVKKQDGRSTVYEDYSVLAKNGREPGFELLHCPDGLKIKVFNDFENRRLVYSLPFTGKDNDGSVSKKADLLFYCGTDDFLRFVHSKNKISLSEKDGAEYVFTDNSGCGGYVFGLPLSNPELLGQGIEVLRENIRQKVLGAVDSGRFELFEQSVGLTGTYVLVDKSGGLSENIVSERDVFSTDGAASSEKVLSADYDFVVFSKVVELGEGNFSFVSFVLDAGVFKVSESLKILLLSLVFLTLFLSVFLLFSLKRDSLTVIEARIRHFEKAFVSAFKKSPEKILPEVLKSRKIELKAEIQKSLGRRGKKHSAALDALFEKSWTKILKALELEPEVSLRTPVAGETVKIDSTELKSALEEILGSGKLNIQLNSAESVNAAKTSRKPVEVEPVDEVETVDEAEPVDELETVEEAEPADELETVEDAEPVDELEAEPAGEVETVEDAEPVDELEAEPADEVETVDDAEPVDEVETVDEIEPVDEVETVDEIEPVDEVEAEPADEVETVDEIEPVDELEAEPADEVEPVEDAEPVDEVETVDEAEPVDELEAEPVDELETVDDAEPVDELETADEAEPVDELEAEPADGLETVDEIEPVDEVETVEDVEPAGEVETVEDAEPVDEVETVDEAEPVDELEAEPAGEVETVEDAEPVDEVETVDDAEPVDEAETVDEIEPVDELEAEPAGEVETVEDAEPVDELEAEPAGEVETVDEIEPADEVETVDEAEPVDEIEPVDEVETVEDAEPADEVEAEPADEVETVDEAESVDELEAEPADGLETVDEIEPADEVETVDEAEPVDELEAEPVDEVETVDEAEPVDEVETVEDAEPADEVETVDEIEPVDELEAEPADEVEAEPASELETVDEAESVDEVEAEPADEVETVDEIEPVNEAETVEDAEPAGELETVEDAELPAEEFKISRIDFSFLDEEEKDGEKWQNMQPADIQNFDTAEQTAAPQTEDESEPVTAPQTADESEPVTAPQTEDESEPAVAPQTADEPVPVDVSQSIDVAEPEPSEEPSLLAEAEPELLSNPEDGNPFVFTGFAQFESRITELSPVSAKAIVESEDGTFHIEGRPEKTDYPLDKSLEALVESVLKKTEL